MDKKSLVAMKIYIVYLSYHLHLISYMRISEASGFKKERYIKLYKKKYPSFQCAYHLGFPEDPSLKVYLLVGYVVGQMCIIVELLN